MYIVNTLEHRSFGPFASATGLSMFVIGAVLAFFHMSLIILVVIGALIAFTSTRTIIDTEKRRVRHADFLFGLIPTGKWVNIKDDMKLGLRKVKRGYTGYVRVNQPMDIKYLDIRIFLFDAGNKKIMPLKSVLSGESEQDQLKEMASLLGLSENFSA
jgi:hypothetical protein